MLSSLYSCCRSLPAPGPALLLNEVIEVIEELRDVRTAKDLCHHCVFLRVMSSTCIYNKHVVE